MVAITNTVIATVHLACTLPHSLAAARQLRLALTWCGGPTAHWRRAHTDARVAAAAAQLSATDNPAATIHAASARARATVAADRAAVPRAAAASAMVGDEGATAARAIAAAA
mmetsp:Transcript_28099/g.85831  ORF Transcript_28099/g.85831 Transcript_28099/m.85831 type:complete len:112 (-) Transcript_28099:1614-1949(-)